MNAAVLGTAHKRIMVETSNWGPEYNWKNESLTPTQFDKESTTSLQVT